MSDAIANSPRLLAKMLPSLSGLNVVDGAWSMPADNPGWDTVFGNGVVSGPTSVKMAGYSTFIDLAGYEQSDLTFVVNGVTWDDCQPISGDMEGVTVLDILSTQQYIVESLGWSIVEKRPSTGWPKSWADGMLSPSPGFPDSVMEMENILFARKSTYYHDQGWSNVRLQQLSNVNTWGECAATAGDRIYVTRLVIPPTNAAVITIPQSIVNIAGVAVEETELAYLMRLRRNYELAAVKE